ncbi:MAG: DUF4349 domain-containing protein [Sphingomonas bacterium]
MRIMFLGVFCLGLGACNESPAGGQKMVAYEVVAPVGTPPPPPEVKPPAPQADAIAVSVPRMAYSYRYSFVLPGPAIARAQQAHLALCDRLGPARCQLLAMATVAGDEHTPRASLKLRVASASARQFGMALENAVAGAGGRAADRAIIAEDVSKDLVDTQARIHQRELLIERLTEILRTRKGTVDELVEAERSVAAAQEELDQAKAWLTELQGRVAMSTIEVEYVATVAAAPVEHAGDSIGETFAASGHAFLIAMGAVLRVLIFSGPWLILAAIGWWGGRRAWRRIRGAADAGEDETPEGEAPQNERPPS